MMNSLRTHELKKEGVKEKKEKKEMKTKQGIKEPPANPSSIKVGDKVTERNKGSVKSKKNLEITIRKFSPGESCILRKRFIYSIFLSRHA